MKYSIDVHRLRTEYANLMIEASSEQEALEKAEEFLVHHSKELEWFKDEELLEVIGITPQEETPKKMTKKNEKYIVTFQVTQHINVAGEYDEKATPADVCAALNDLSKEAKKELIDRANKITVLKANKATFFPAFEEQCTVECDVPHVRYARINVKKTETVTVSIPLPPTSASSNFISKIDTEYLEDLLDAEETQRMLFDKFPGYDPEYTWEYETDRISEADEFNINIWDPKK